jgi:glucose/arabinose dehydrogenase
MKEGARRIIPLFISLFVLIGLGALQASTLPDGFSESRFGGSTASISSPTAMAFAPDGRLFICQQDGRLRVIKQGILLATPFLTVSVDSQGERGLLGIAFDPNFATNQFVYIYYTTQSAPVHNRVSRFTAAGDVALAGSETIILDLDNLSGATNHNGGAIHFGRDGKLYIAVGENANTANAQTLNNVLGKMLRINSDGTIPNDNPFLGQTTGKNQAIWALGLRNPFTFNFQPGTGRILINDVGAGTWEEVNEGIAGANYGWPNCEGPCVPAQPAFRDPVSAYTHASSGGCAIAGGTFYNPAVGNFPTSFQGKYFFADLCGGFIRLLDPDSRAVSTFATGIQQPVDLQIGPDGALYYLQIGGGGQVWRVTSTSGQGSGSNPVQSVFTLHRPVTDGTDYDGDSKTDVTVYRRRDSVWLVRQSSNGATVSQQWGLPGDLPAPGDYDGDNKSDFAVWRKSTGTWFVIPSGGGASITRQWGAPGDIPVPGDYDGDGRTDFAIWRRTTGTWFAIQSSSGTSGSRQWGTPGDIPVPGDYDGDGRTDLAVWRESDNAWYVIQSSSGARIRRQWGLPGDVPVTGDFDGDGKLDFTVWRESDGTWYIIQSSNGSMITRQWGIPGDVPVPGDYDGDNKSDFAIWRESDGAWRILNSTNGAEATQLWGSPGDTPISVPSY